ncbi:MAG TPA: thrombospondin type 3 repeat-containing protein [Pontiellaceae bacterium]|nr:thrombospondin type 3 repeat-containing protein [Pontiellaceae bacterium]HPR83244.1 thrombospondin type 3 repeat-containing protein [Pontiellaceae bacterium]
MKTRLISLLFFLMAGSSPAVLFYSTGDASYHTNAPTGALEGSGWQFQGRFGSYLGTPISPHHFIAAQHISAGTSVGTKFYYNGSVYTTTAKTNDSASDLTIWTVAERFTSYAPLYSGTSESGKGLVVFGRGVDRGVAITNTLTTITGHGQSTTTNVTVITNGWKWGSYNYTQRWGTNLVSTTATMGGYPVLVANWDAGGDDCMLADKDSSGGVFIQESGVWKLAGINYSIGPSATYSFNSDGSSPFNAAILDFRGDAPLYYFNGTSWVSLPSSQKSSFFVSRISSRYSWITNNVTDFDQDVDLLPDWWEKTYTNSATAMSASDDNDGDGFSNLQEYTADTNPTNAASFFEISGFLASANQTVYFTGSTGRQYQVFYTTNDLASTDLVWIAANTNTVWGFGTNSSITVTNTADKAFYRLRVTAP